MPKSQPKFLPTCNKTTCCRTVFDDVIMCCKVLVTTLLCTRMVDGCHTTRLDSISKRHRSFAIEATVIPLVFPQIICHLLNTMTLNYHA